MERSIAEVNCVKCGKPFKPRCEGHALCSDKCRRAIRGNEYRRQRARALYRDNFTCTEPNCTSTDQLECHHLISINQGGTHELDNLSTKCHIHHTEIHHQMRQVAKANKEAAKHEARGGTGYREAA